MHLDEIGPWSEMKLKIVKDYAKVYSTILKKYPRLKYYYIDAFSGPGIHKRKKTGEFIPGSPLNVLSVRLNFHGYYFMDKDCEKIGFLKKLIGPNENIKYICGDSNVLLIKEVFPEIKYEDYKRALCFLDPYGLHLDWKVVEFAGKMKTIEVFILFPLEDMNRNILHKNPVDVKKNQKIRMNAFWGDESWFEYTYEEDLPDLFGEPTRFKDKIDILLKAYKKRLKNIANFQYVPDPIPFRNKKNAIIYYIYFATQKKTAYDVVNYILKKYSKTGRI
nr:three-Cys-motif partner protein TcmP [candidate division Zixibacteria bacterium]